MSSRTKFCVLGPVYSFYAIRGLAGFGGREHVKNWFEAEMAGQKDQEKGASNKKFDQNRIRDVYKVKKVSFSYVQKIC